MFAAIIPGKLVQPISQVDSSLERFLTILENVESLNHICIFLTGVAAFPDGYGCSIHLGSARGWQFIGGLSNAKPSAIFKLRGSFTPSTTFSSSSLPINSASLGIQIEPLTSVEAQLATLNSIPPPGSSTAMVLARPSALNPSTIAQKIALNCFTFLSGFEVVAPDGKGYIETSAVERWYRNIEAKLRNGGAGFLTQNE